MSLHHDTLQRLGWQGLTRDVPGAHVTTSERGILVTLLPRPGVAQSRHYLVRPDGASFDGRRVVCLRHGSPNNTRNLFVGTTRRLVCAAIENALKGETYDSFIRTA